MQALAKATERIKTATSIKKEENVEGMSLPYMYDSIHHGGYYYDSTLHGSTKG